MRSFDSSPIHEQRCTEDDSLELLDLLPDCVSIDGPSSFDEAAAMNNRAVQEWLVKRGAHGSSASLVHAIQHFDPGLKEDVKLRVADGSEHSDCPCLRHLLWLLDVCAIAPDVSVVLTAIKCGYVDIADDFCRANPGIATKSDIEPQAVDDAIVTGKTKLVEWLHTNIEGLVGSPDPAFIGAAINKRDLKLTKILSSNEHYPDEGASTVSYVLQPDVPLDYLELLTKTRPTLFESRDEEMVKAEDEVTLLSNYSFSTSHCSFAFDQSPNGRNSLGSHHYIRTNFSRGVGFQVVQVHPLGDNQNGAEDSVTDVGSGNETSPRLGKRRGKNRSRGRRLETPGLTCTARCAEATDWRQNPTHFEVKSTSGHYLWISSEEFTLYFGSVKREAVTSNINSFLDVLLNLDNFLELELAKFNHLRAFPGQKELRPEQYQLILSKILQIDDYTNTTFRCFMSILKDDPDPKSWY